MHAPGEERPAYFLVELGAPGAVIALGAVDADGGAIMASARLPGAGAHLAISGEQAVRAAGMPEAARRRLVWRPSRQSRSPLYPLWEVRSAAAVAYVDLTGRVHPGLEPGGPGG